jgi:hypothetical protein
MSTEYIARLQSGMSKQQMSALIAETVRRAGMERSEYLLVLRYGEMPQVSCDQGDVVLVFAGNRLVIEFRDPSDARNEQVLASVRLAMRSVDEGAVLREC